MQEPILAFYRRPEIQAAILENGKGREIAVKFGERGFGKRPDLLRYPGDIGELAAQGATSFHISEERWSNPLSLKTGMPRGELDTLRVGWDLILDIDCKEFEYSKITAFLIIEWLRHSGISSISCKFSGNKGFHIGVPFESFPVKIGGSLTSSQFPEAPRRVAAFIQEKIKEPLAKKIIELEDGDFASIAKKAGFTDKSEILQSKNGVNTVNVEAFLEIDTVLISSRHLYRSAYSFNEKSGLVSLPIDPSQVLAFKRDMAKPETIPAPSLRFLDPSRASSVECKALFTAAYDFQPDLREEEENQERKTIEIPAEAFPKEAFPPCIHGLLAGLEDGKKRALFILINFLMSCGWSPEQIEAEAREWNKKNKPPLSEHILIGQLRYRKERQAMLPPNCVNASYMDIHICKPDNLCKMIKNPVQYAKRKKGNEEPKKTKQMKKEEE